MKKIISLLSVFLIITILHSEKMIIDKKTKNIYSVFTSSRNSNYDNKCDFFGDGIQIYGASQLDFEVQEIQKEKPADLKPLKYKLSPANTTYIKLNYDVEVSTN